MKPVDFVIIAVIALLVVLAIISIRRQKKRGGCCGCGVLGPPPSGGVSPYNKRRADHIRAPFFINQAE